MYQNLTIFDTAARMASYAGQRQAITAQNIANADTPGFQAKYVPDFKDVMGQTGNMGLRATREGHIQSSPRTADLNLLKDKLEASPNQNTVSLEQEMMRAVEIAREHNRALTVYKHSMNVIRSAIGR